MQCAVVFSTIQPVAQTMSSFYWGSLSCKPLSVNRVDGVPWGRSNELLGNWSILIATKEII